MIPSSTHKASSNLNVTIVLGGFGGLVQGHGTPPPLPTLFFSLIAYHFLFPLPIQCPSPSQSDPPLAPLWPWVIYLK